jgi:hypothetical protein
MIMGFKKRMAASRNAPPPGCEFKEFAQPDKLFAAMERRFNEIDEQLFQMEERSAARIEEASERTESVMHQIADDLREDMARQVSAVMNTGAENPTPEMMQALR